MSVKLFFLFFFTFSAIADDRLAGLWAWAGKGCRDANLSAQSHNSNIYKFIYESGLTKEQQKMMEEEELASIQQIKNTIAQFTRDGTVKLIATDGVEESTHTGIYTLQGNKVIVTTLLADVDLTYIEDSIGPSLIQTKTSGHSFLSYCCPEIVVVAPDQDLAIFQKDFKHAYRQEEAEAVCRKKNTYVEVMRKI